MTTRRKLGPIWIAVAAAFIAVAFGGGYLIYGKSGDPFRTLEKLDPEAYLENANGLRGNVYKIDGVVQNSLAWSPESGRLFAIATKDGSNESFLPVLIPNAFNHFNVQKGQKILLKVEVVENGFIKAMDVRKP
jgi:hypothetical protein